MGRDGVVQRPLPRAEPHKEDVQAPVRGGGGVSGPPNTAYVPGETGLAGKPCILIAELKSSNS